MSSSQLRHRSQTDFVDPQKTKFAHVATILTALTQSRDAAVFTITGTYVRTEVTSGRFDRLANEPLDSAFESLCHPLSLKVGSCLVVEIDDEAREKLSLTNFPDGSLALCCLQSHEHAITCAAIFESRANGLLGPSQISALQATAKLLVPTAPTPAPSRELIQLRNFHRRFSQAVRQCFWVFDTETTEVLTVSENFEDVWGMQRSVLMQGGLSGFMSNVLPDDRDRVLAEFHENLDSNEFDLEFRVLDPQGEIHWMWVRMCRFFDETSPHSRLMLMIADDVTDKKQVEESAREQEANLVSRARALAVVDLASGVAHEINNPLTIIVGRASELRRRIARGEATPEIQLEAIDKIQATAVRIADIIKSLKSLARQDRGQGFPPAPMSIIAREVADLSMERFKSHDVKLEIQDPADGMMAEMNPTLISQVILNLVNNALDAVAPQEHAWVKVDFSDDTDSLYIGVTDSGSGIPIKIRQRIFDPFFTTKEPGKGTGLGLSLSTSIAAHHDGMLRLDTFSTHTRFVLQIPKKQIKKVSKAS